ncbi:hypothetical protein [Nonomuraea sp. NPDC050540]|uniref:hypothetical protein n=1 Tax=Nonomuraea sp. NPDC050540 TaxID=3364367 RepID=UPI0037A79B99
MQSRLASFDHDQDGVITRADLDLVTGRALAAFGLAATSQQGKALADAAAPWVAALIAAADRDEDGKLTAQEYRSVLRALGADEQTLGQISKSGSPVPVESAKNTALKLFADQQPDSPATWAFGTT